jgi:hypothetical protein
MWTDFMMLDQPEPTLMQLLTLLVAIFSPAVTLFFRKYFEKKAENLATKEDIAAITREIEDVKHDYAEKLESAKASISAQMNRHGFRYEREFEILGELSACLVDLRDAILALRPVFDFRDPKKTEDDIKAERLERLYATEIALYECHEKKRPFYPDDIYVAIRQISKTARLESAGYQFKRSGGKEHLAYWDEAEKNQKTMLDQTEAAMQKIRERVTTWET